MRTFLMAAVLLGFASLSGCGESSEPVTDPAELSPLTDEQKAEIKTLDESIDEEEKASGM